MGDIVRVQNEGGTFDAEVLGLSVTRGPAAVAQTLFRETDASVAARLKLAEDRKAVAPSGLPRTGKPSKRDRREIARLRGY